MSNPTFINPLNITETGEIQSELDYISSIINANFAPLPPASAPEVTRVITTDGLPAGDDGYTAWGTDSNNHITNAFTIVDPTFENQDFLNLHELGRVLGLPTNTNTTDPTVSIMIPASIADTYQAGYLDTLHTYGTADIATLQAEYGTADQNIVGTASNDSISAYGGNDTVSALAGNDSVNGNQGNDSLLGGMGNDTLHGGQGNDTLSAEKGNDQIWGDLGNDTFLISGLTSGHDTIMDFTHGQDVINLQGTIFAKWTGVSNHLSQVGTDAVLTFDSSDSLILHGLYFGALSASDFIFS